MWEFSISLNSDKNELASSIFNILKKELAKFNAIVAISNQNEYFCIVIAVDNNFKNDAEIILLRTITLAICQSFKADYLNKYLSLPNQDEIRVTAFKKALINFDKETDYFIISKAINFDEFLYLESFYQFKLKKLRDKWGELVRLANENRDYLVSTDAFFDLLKFLIDNLDIEKEEIDVVEDEKGYYICDEGTKSQPLSSSALISSLIDLSPQKINMYCSCENSATSLLQTIFDRRFNLLSTKENNIENIENLNFLLK